VSAQLYVRNMVDRAEGGKHTVEVFAAEHGEFNLLALVLVAEVFHQWVVTRLRESPRWSLTGGSQNGAEPL